MEDFKWTDDLVEEFIHTQFGSNKESVYSKIIINTMDDFKKSKQPPKDYEILQYNTEGEIYSVKRLSDGEVFTVGEVTGGVSYNSRMIERFLIYGDELMIKQYGGRTRLDALKKTKQPLFITEDVVSIYEEDKNCQLCAVYADFTSAPYLAVEAYNAKMLSPTTKFFYSLEKARTYIQENEPRFSLSEISKVVEKNIRIPAIKDNILKDLSEL